MLCRVPEGILYPQVVKNLVFLAKVLHRLNLAGSLKLDTSESFPATTVDRIEDGRGGEEESLVEKENEHTHAKDLRWLINKLERLTKHEAGHHPKESLKRICVLQWTAAMSQDLGGEHLPAYLPALLRPVYRELTNSRKTAGETLHSLAQEVGGLMKSVCGREDFSKAYTHVHQSVIATKVKRRKQAALEVSRY